MNPIPNARSWPMTPRSLRPGSAIGAVLKTLLIGAILPAPLMFAAVTFTAPDAFVGFRKSGGANNLVVNIGSVLTLKATTPGATVPIGGFNVSQIEAAVSDLNSLRLSVSSATRPGDGNPGGFADNTLWLTRQRTVLGTQSTPWNRSSSVAQGNVSSRVRAVGTGAATFSAGAAAGPNNTDTAVVIPDSNTRSYRTQVGTGGNWNGTFQGNTEATTPATFTTGGVPVILDFYEITPRFGRLPVSRFL